MTQDETIRSFLTAASAMLDMAVLQARQDDPEGVACLAAAVRAGALTRVSLTVSAAGMAWAACEVIEPNGQVTPVSTMELDYSSHTQPGGNNN
jgi:hypothetical protein